MITEELEVCIKYGAGMSAKLPGIEFTINPRNLPDDIPPRPVKPPLFRDVKEVLTRHDWLIIREKYDKRWVVYSKAVAAHRAGQQVVAKLRKIQAMVLKIENWAGGIPR